MQRSCKGHNASCSIDYIIVEKDYSKFKNKIVSFISKIDTEKKYFNITLERTLKAIMIVFAIDNDNIIGFSGNEQKYKVEHYLRIVRSLTIINKNYHGRNIGTLLHNQRITTTIEKRYNMMLAIIEEENLIARNLIEKMNYKLIGITDNLAYYSYIITKKGYLLYFILSVIFPLIRLFKKIRR